MASFGEVARNVAALGESASTVAAALEAEYREAFATMDRIQRTFRDQDAGAEALRCLSTAQGMLVEASEEMREARAKAEAYAAKLRG